MSDVKKITPLRYDYILERGTYYAYAGDELAYDDDDMDFLHSGLLFVTDDGEVRLGVKYVLGE